MWNYGRLDGVRLRKPCHQLRVARLELLTDVATGDFIPPWFCCFGDRIFLVMTTSPKSSAVILQFMVRLEKRKQAANLL